ncbi:MAG: RNA-binding protein [Methylococcaceae bacterium]|nr:RNA-binding protein [Methylococcaceae bacterium]
MIIILKRIPENTKKADIIEYLDPVIKGKIFQKTGVIEQVQIKALKDPQTHTIEFYGLVVIDYDEVADRVIKKFNRKVFKGKNIAVSEFHIRSWQNDRRILQDLPDKNFKSKRVVDRRRFSLKEKKTSIGSYTSQQSFHRKL